MDDPYSSVDWQTVQSVHSVNHEHTFAANPGGDEWKPLEEGSATDVWDRSQSGQAAFEVLYDRGIRHFALSNYNPAKPTYPLEAYFEDVPADALGCPNAEHSCGDPGHYCSLGSRFRSINRTYDRSWRELFRSILDELAYDAGGGIVVNHPRRSGLTVDDVAERLEFDPRVLGIEAWNHRGVIDPKSRGRGNALQLWDELLMTGRQVSGFFNPDYHAPWNVERWGHGPRGRNVLLVPEATEEAAARAYRQGRFYGALDGSGLTFERLEATSDEVVVETTGAARIDFITAGRSIHTEYDSAATYRTSGTEPYVRVEAHDDTGERVFSQPVLYS